MNEFNRMAAALAFLASCLVWSSKAVSQVVTSGEVVIGDFDGDGLLDDGSVDRIAFHVTVGTTVNFDALIFETPPQRDLNGDGEITATDGGMLLLDADYNVLVAHDDGPAGDDGSFTGLDGNFDYTFTTAGTYILAVGAAYRLDYSGGYVLTASAAQQGFVQDYGVRYGLFQDHADWQVTLTAAGGSISNVIVDTRGSPATPNPNLPPEVMCGVIIDTLWPPDNSLADVGLLFDVADDSDPHPAVDVLVYSNEAEDAAGGDRAADAVLDADDALRLRAQRQGNGLGRVFLIVVVAMDADGETGFDCCSVAVPHNAGPEATAFVDQMAQLAEEVCLEKGDAPPGFQLVAAFPDP